MAKRLDRDDSAALLKHYGIDVSGEFRPHGIAIACTGEAAPSGKASITVSIGKHRAHRICPVTDFLAHGMVGELQEAQLTLESQAGRAMAHLIVNLSRLQVESSLIGFSLTAIFEGDHYEVLTNSVTIEASDQTEIPQRLSPHAHDAGTPHAPQRPY